MASRLKIGRAELAWPVLQIGQLRFAFSSERTASMLSPSGERLNVGLDVALLIDVEDCEPCRAFQAQRSLKPPVFHTSTFGRRLHPGGR